MIYVGHVTMEFKNFTTRISDNRYLVLIKDIVLNCRIDCRDWCIFINQYRSAEAAEKHYLISIKHHDYVVSGKYHFYNEETDEHLYTEKVETFFRVVQNDQAAIKECAIEDLFKPARSPFYFFEENAVTLYYRLVNSRKSFCNECGQFLQEEKILCWACENGI